MRGPKRGQESARQRRRTGHIDGERLIPQRARRVRHRRHFRQAGAVDERVHLLDVRKGVRERIESAEVCGARNDVAVLQRRKLVRRTTDGVHAVAVRGECAHHGPADPARRAGHDRRLRHRQSLSLLALLASLIDRSGA